MDDNLSVPKTDFPFVPLPACLNLPKELENEACPWLDEFIKYSENWSPRSYYGFFEAAGLWVLSTIAANRVGFNLGKRRSTSLQIICIGRTGISAKSTATDIGTYILKSAGLDWLLLPGTCTPQKLIELMVTKLPAEYNSLTKLQKEKAQKVVGFAGQRGWFFDEFGFYIQGMMSPNGGAYSDFRTLLRKLDDCDDVFEKATLTRDIEIIDKPYLSLLGCLTPADLLPYAKKGSMLWNDGFFARIAIVAPPSNFLQNGEFPIQERKPPKKLITPLTVWHERLGLPKVLLTGDGVNVTNTSPNIILIPKQIHKQFYLYDNYLRELTAHANVQDLDGNYVRFSEKAMRVATLFASLANEPEIGLCHWARARKITEGWRKDLHELYSQMNSGVQPRPLTNREKILREIITKFNPTSREIQQYTKIPAVEVQEILDQLVNKSVIFQKKEGRALRYIHESKLDSVTEI